MTKKLNPCLDCGIARNTKNTDRAGALGLAKYCKECKPKHDFTAAERQRRYRERYDGTRTPEGEDRERIRKREWARKNSAQKRQKLGSQTL